VVDIFVNGQPLKKLVEHERSEISGLDPRKPFTSQPPTSVLDPDSYCEVSYCRIFLSSFGTNVVRFFNFGANVGRFFLNFGTNVGRFLCKLSAQMSYDFFLILALTSDDFFLILALKLDDLFYFSH